LESKEMIEIASSKTKKARRQYEKSQSRDKKGSKIIPEKSIEKSPKVLMALESSFWDDPITTFDDIE
ncbi:hypothetical protein I9Y66_003986, partial [Proteus mirabilis]